MILPTRSILALIFLVPATLLVSGADLGAPATAATPAPADGAGTRAFLEQHCADCHDADTKKGGLDLSALPTDLSKPEAFARWVKVHDYIVSGEMPPKKKPRPAADATATVTAQLRTALVAADRARLAGEGRTGVRRLTRAEYEHTLRDLFDMPGVALQGELPADGSAHGFDNHSDALDVSHVNLAKYV